jgi:uncharacterized LabA/DUF88 family protein
MSGGVEHKYLFIDGACLSKIEKDINNKYFEKSSYIMDFNLIGENYHKIYYYDAVPAVAKTNETSNEFIQRQKAKLDELQIVERTPRFHVRTGEVRRESKHRGNEQKMVDVQLAVDAVHMASRNLFKYCTLITGDLDFLPLVSALVDMGVDVELLYPPNQTPLELRNEADRCAPLSIYHCSTWLRPILNLKDKLPKIYNNNVVHANMRILSQFTDEIFGIITCYCDGNMFIVDFDNIPDYRSYIFQNRRGVRFESSDKRILFSYLKDSFNIDLEIGATM